MVQILLFMSQKTVNKKLEDTFSLILNYCDIFIQKSCSILSQIFIRPSLDFLKVKMQDSDKERGGWELVMSNEVSYLQCSSALMMSS